MRWLVILLACLPGFAYAGKPVEFGVDGGFRYVSYGDYGDDVKQALFEIPAVGLAVQPFLSESVQLDLRGSLTYRELQIERETASSTEFELRAGIVGNFSLWFLRASGGWSYSDPMDEGLNGVEQLSISGAFGTRFPVSETVAPILAIEITRAFETQELLGYWSYGIVLGLNFLSGGSYEALRSKARADEGSVGG